VFLNLKLFPKKSIKKIENPIKIGKIPIIAFATLFAELYKVLGVCAYLLS
jgi:hypothetical protein